MALNVRLDAQDARRTKALREAGVNISTLVRTAIRDAYNEHLGAVASRGKRSAIVNAILEALPDPEDLNPQRIEAADRRGLRRRARAKLRRAPR